MDFWFTSDTHYGHANIIKFCKRPFASVEEMNEALIEKHNANVKPNDIVYHLGDVCWFKTPEELVRLLGRLNGRFRFLRGNHDNLFRGAFRDCKKVDWVKDYNQEWFGDQFVTMFHYPIGSWNKAHRGSWMIHGHCHATYHHGWPNRSDMGRIIDAGVDCHDYRPINFDDIRPIMAECQKRTLRYNDGFTDVNGNPLVRDSSGELTVNINNE